MKSDSLEALRAANPRNQPGFQEWVDRLAGSSQITAAPRPDGPVPRRPSLQRRVAGLSAVAAVLTAAVVALTLGPVSPPSAYAAARQAITVTTGVGSGTITVTASHNGTTYTLNTARWNGKNAQVTTGPRHLLGTDKQMLLIGGAVYLQQADGRWLRYPNSSELGPRLGRLVQTARDDVTGTSAEQILALVSGGLRRTKESNGTLVYAGTIPDLTGTPETRQDGSVIMQTITNLQIGNGTADPGGFHRNLRLRMIVSSDGLVRQLCLTYRQTDTGSPTTDGVYTWTIAYSHLARTPPITQPHQPLASVSASSDRRLVEGAGKRI
jgi:hypothetical protein